MAPPKIDQLSQTWRDVSGYAADRIEKQRDLLETAPPTSIPLIQGRIEAWRELLALADEKKPLPAITTKPDY